MRLGFANSHGGEDGLRVQEQNTARSWSWAALMQRAVTPLSHAPEADYACSVHEFRILTVAACQHSKLLCEVAANVRAGIELLGGS